MSFHCIIQLIRVNSLSWRCLLNLLIFSSSLSSSLPLPPLPNGSFTLRWDCAERSCFSSWLTMICAVPTSVMERVSLLRFQVWIADKMSVCQVTLLIRNMFQSPSSLDSVVEPRRPFSPRPAAMPTASHTASQKSAAVKPAQPFSSTAYRSYTLIFRLPNLVLILKPKILTP